MPEDISRTFRSLSAITVGDTPMARLVYAILAVMPASSDHLGEALTELGRATMTEPWTVYYWLRGKFAPSMPRQQVLQELAEGHGLNPDVVMWGSAAKAKAARLKIAKAAKAAKAKAAKDRAVKAARLKAEAAKTEVAGAA